MSADDNLPRDGEPWPDEAFIRGAVEQANLNALRLALFQQTCDPALTTMRIEPRAVRGGSMSVMVVAPDDRAALKEKAVAYLRGGPVAPCPAPDIAETARLLDLFGAPADDPMMLRRAVEELAFSDMPRALEWRQRPSAEVLAGYDVTIIGAGISGLATGIRLKALGIPFRIIERQSGVRGCPARC